MDINEPSSTRATITLDADTAASLVYSLADVITLSKRRTIDGQRYLLLHETMLKELSTCLLGLVKGISITKDQAA